MQDNEAIIQRQRAFTDFYISKLNEPVTQQEIESWIIEMRKAEIKRKYASGF